ncbi:FAD-binding domain-containing protein [uncultured Erythrobacter sp.]|uniref:FAD-binding domain-containing protein n=1 Tax=uncultured Erythrobacter sp. TaxID=263913 RepID=UPI002611A936|nr:FAD-binding domain-containing protein [uncultured Erythrobacter sp.]
MTFAPTRTAGLERLSDFVPHAGTAYTRTRNFDDGAAAEKMRQNVSQLSPWLRAGLLGETEVIKAILEHHGPTDAESFISEVFWRIYFKGDLEQRPSIWTSYCKGRDAAFAVLDADAALAEPYTKATEGRTGISAFDHWSRELTQTGYLHNHARMWFASIWIFTLKLDWQLGADFFLRHLIDGDAASNTLSWRWVAGLHTKGKTYLARADNIARFTDRHPDGPLAAEGLAEHAEPLEEPIEHARSMPDLPSQCSVDAPYALLLHDEGASHGPLELPHKPSLIIAAARPKARSPRDIGTQARDFASQAVLNGGKAAGEAFGCEVVQWGPKETLASLLENAGIECLATPYLPTGWTRSALWADLSILQQHGELAQLVAQLDRAAWPHAKAGFFRIKKAIPGILGELGFAGG